MVVPALPRRLTEGAFRAVRALTALPRIPAVLTDLRDAAEHLERLATFAAEELPEIVFQLEGIREQLTAIERRLGSRDGGPISSGAPRTGSPRPS